jgi:hypothetical protein
MQSFMVKHFMTPFRADYDYEHEHDFRFCQEITWRFWHIVLKNVNILYGEILYIDIYIRRLIMGSERSNSGGFHRNRQPH